MGLTVYYDFRLPLTVASGEVQQLLARWREFAVGLRAGRVTAPILAHPQFERLELAGERHAARVTELVRQVVRERKNP